MTDLVRRRRQNTDGRLSEAGEGRILMTDFLNEPAKPEEGAGTNTPVHTHHLNKCFTTKVSDNEKCMQHKK